MKVRLVMVGKTDERYLEEGTDKYVKRIKHYLPLETITIPAQASGRNTNPATVKQMEAGLILSKTKDSDFVILLDEKGKQKSSKEFADYLNKLMNRGLKQVVFVIGGPFGFSDEVHKKANDSISLSQMTFSHQMVRLIFLEQLYRAMTILKNEKYHHD